MSARSPPTGARAGVLFGRERTGLNNEELSLADEILTFPVDPGFASLNLAQAVLLFAYEWRLAGLRGGGGGPAASPTGGRVPAPKEDLIRLFEHLESALDATGFFRPPEKRPHMVEALRAMLQRAGFSEQEVRTLRGVVDGAGEAADAAARALPDGTVTTGRGKDEGDE